MMCAVSKLICMILFGVGTLAESVIGPLANEVLSADYWPVYVHAELGQKCARNIDCAHTRFAQCHDETCSCYPYHIQYNATTCLPASLLGYGCLVSEQCQMKVASSHCVNGVCVCERGYAQFRKDNCLVGARVGHFCSNDEQCQLFNSGSYCRFVIPKLYGRCTCSPGFIVGGNLRCIPQSSLEVVVSLGKSCQSSAQCQTRDLHSHCLNGTCQCIWATSHCGAHNTGCHRDTFQCRNGDCISWYFVCDGGHDCKDGSDEEECIRGRCPKEAFQCGNGNCVSRSKLCNGKLDCWDGSDERHCYKDCNNTLTFPCRDGPCLPQYMFCNAVSSCKDRSDEDPETCEFGHQCPKEYFRCKNGRCRSTAVLCSGKDGCGDNSDEVSCKVCFCPRSN